MLTFVWRPVLLVSETGLGISDSPGLANNPRDKFYYLLRTFSFRRKSNCFVHDILGDSIMSYMLRIAGAEEQCTEQLHMLGRYSSLNTTWG